ncbi:MAG: hypothetical protein ACM3US_09850 [Sphingomonadaceae bacterium]
MSRTDEILAGITREIEIRREAIDRDPTLTSISVIVYLTRAGGRPKDVSFRTESKSAIPAGPRGENS